MADKEATVYIVDLGRSMGKQNQGRDQTDLDWAMLYVWDKITSIVALERKTTLQGFVGLKTDSSLNGLVEEDEAFAHIAVYQELATLSLTDLRRLQQLCTPSKTNRGDAISAIVIAIQMIEKFCKKLKFRKKIVLVTNGTGAIDADDTSEIARKLVNDNIELVVLGVDFDDSDFGFKEEDKTQAKRENETKLRLLAESSSGIFGTLAEAIAELGQPRLKTTKPVASYKDQLVLGHPQFKTDLSIYVERYPRTNVRKPATASSYVVVDAKSSQQIPQSSSKLPVESSEDTVMTDAHAFSAVKNTRHYEVIDETGMDGKRHVTQDELAKGYEYGRTAVHIEESDQPLLKLESPQKLEIIGFIPSENYEQYMGLSKTNVIIGRPGDTESTLALSSLIQALAELQSFAIGRLVLKQDRPPVLLLLAPLIEPECECLIDVELPFAEDVRSYKFPPLDRVVTIAGKSLKEHRNLPSDDLVSAMSDYVDQMDLSTFEKDEDGNPAEYLTMTDAFSPVVHRIEQGVRFRAIHPNDPIPPAYDILTRYSKPPSELVAATKTYLDRLIAESNVKPVPPKVQSRRRAPTNNPISGLDVQGLIAKSADLSISADNPIPSFKQFFEKTQDPDGISKGASQLGAIIEYQIRGSFGSSAYEQALEEMKLLQTYMKDYEEPNIWNDWIKKFKDKLQSGRLGGDRSEFWFRIKQEKLGLVEGPLSNITEAEAKSFWKQT